MTDFLNALKTDLSDRRLLPFVALVGVALLAAVAYVIVGGGSSGSSTPTATVAPVTASAPPSKLATVTQASTEKPAAETTEGTNAQHRGVARDPFVGLPVKTSKAAAAATPSTSAGSTPKTGESTPKTGGSTPAPTKPSTPAKPKTVYRVAVMFGTIPPGHRPAGCDVDALCEPEAADAAALRRAAAARVPRRDHPRHTARRSRSSAKRSCAAAQRACRTRRNAKRSTSSRGRPSSSNTCRRRRSGGASTNCGS